MWLFVATRCGSSAGGISRSPRWGVAGIALLIFVVVSSVGCQKQRPETPMLAQRTGALTIAVEQGVGDLEYFNASGRQGHPFMGFNGVNYLVHWYDERTGTGSAAFVDSAGKLVYPGSIAGDVAAGPVVFGGTEFFTAGFHPPDVTALRLTAEWQPIDDPPIIINKGGGAPK